MIYTDRGNDNWLIRYESAPILEGTTCLEHERESICEVSCNIIIVLLVQSCIPANLLSTKV